MDDRRNFLLLSIWGNGGPRILLDIITVWAKRTQYTIRIPKSVCLRTAYPLDSFETKETRWVFGDHGGLNKHTEVAGKSVF